MIPAILPSIHFGGEAGHQTLRPVVFWKVSQQVRGPRWHVWHWEVQAVVSRAESRH